MRKSKKSCLLVFLLAASASNSVLCQSEAAVNVKVEVTVCDRNNKPVSGKINYTMNYDNGNGGFVTKSQTIGPEGTIAILCSQNTNIEVKPKSEIYYAVVDTCQSGQLKLLVPNFGIIQHLISNLERALKKGNFAVASLVFSEFAASKRKGLLSGSQIDYGLSGSQTEYIGELLKSSEFDSAVASLTEFYLGREHNLHYEAPLHRYLVRPFSGTEEAIDLYGIHPFANLGATTMGLFMESDPYSAAKFFSP